MSEPQASQMPDETAKFEFFILWSKLCLRKHQFAKFDQSIVS